MDPLYAALSQFRKRHYDRCIEMCTDILEKQPLDEAAWCLKTRALTQRVYVDDLETEDVLEADFLDDHAVASTPRPGTSMKTGMSSATNGLMSSRPRTSTGRPISGIARPGTQGRPGSAIDRLKTSRPLNTQSARAVRLGTAAMLSQCDGPFIQVSRVNVAKYARDRCLAKPLFEYLYYHEGDVKTATDLAVQASRHAEFKDWWWRARLSKCYVALNFIRDAEQQLRSALKLQHHVETFLRLARVYQRLDQPLSATEICKAGLEVFPADVSLLTELARISEAVNDTSASVKYYRNVVFEDATDTEAIACIGLYHFYNNQPELAFRYYRRVLVMGAQSAELYTNLGLCCLYSQQLDVTFSCFERALTLAVESNIQAEIWYNLSHLATTAGDMELAMQCLNLCLSLDPSHAAAFNNLAVLHHKTGSGHLAKSYFQTASHLSENLVEPRINLEYLQNI